jgi:hypothetical protein
VSGPDAHKDLDSIPPRTYARDSDVRGHWLHTSITSDSVGVQIALVTKSGTPLGFTQCRDEVYANGSDQDTDSLQPGDELCILTSQGRIAHLTTASADVPDLVPIVKFTVTVWDPPQQTRGG